MIGGAGDRFAGFEREGGQQFHPLGPHPPGDDAPSVPKAKPRLARQMPSFGLNPLRRRVLQEVVRASFGRHDFQILRSFMKRCYYFSDSFRTDSGHQCVPSYKSHSHGPRNIC